MWRELIVLFPHPSTAQGCRVHSAPTWIYASNKRLPTVCPDPLPAVPSLGGVMSFLLWLMLTLLCTGVCLCATPPEAKTSITVCRHLSCDKTDWMLIWMLIITVLFCLEVVVTGQKLCLPPTASSVHWLPPDFSKNVAYTMWQKEK